jgi:DNA-directed RNA polymerase subunit RPC12/RpoP
MPEIITLDGKPRRTRKCPECGNEFPILNKTTKAPVCEDCHKKILAELPELRKKELKLSKKRWEIEEVSRKYGGWCNYGQQWPSEEMCREKCNEWNAVIKEQNAAGRTIQKYEEYFEKRYEDDLMEIPSRCNHEFEHLSLTSAHGENPINEMRVEYWASVSCLKCGTGDLHLHARVS